MKLQLQRREENIKGFIRGRTNYTQFLVTSLQYTDRTWKKLAIVFKLQPISILATDPKPNIANTSFCALADLLLTKLNHYFDDFIVSNMFLGHSKWHKK